MLFPLYPALGPAVARTRRIAGRPGATAADREAHGRAVLAAVRDLQARELGRAVPDAPIRCASGTRHLDGESILAAIRAQHAASLARTRPHERTDAQWRDAYAAAMAERRRAESLAKVRGILQPDRREFAPRVRRPRASKPMPFTRTAIVGAVGVAISFAA